MQSMLKLLKIKIFVVSILILFSYPACRKDAFRFPYVSINLNLGINSDLGGLAPGGLKLLPKNPYGGVGGLIVYQDFEYHYFVFDAACTHDYYDGCYVEPGESFPELMVCPCCSSSFLLSSDGNVFKSPAKYPLVQYLSYRDGEILRVQN